MYRPVRDKWPVMDNILYFAYGSNLHPDWLCSRVIKAETVTTARLQGWRLYFHKQGTDDSAKCNIIKTGNDDDRIHGVIYRIDQDKKPALDRAESGYRSEYLNIAGFDNVLVYLAERDMVNDLLLPYTWYHDIVLAGAQHHQLPDEYIAFIASFNSARDTDKERDKRYRSVVFHNQSVQV